MTQPPDPARGTGARRTRMAHEWYIDASGRTEGPLSDSELRVRAAGGLLLPTDRVSSDRATWVAADTVPGLSFPSATTRTSDLGSTILPAPKPSRPLVETVVSGTNSRTDSAVAFAPLDSVPGYDLQGTLGTGACGVVFRAVQKKLNRVVALKTVRMAQNTPADVLDRFEQEAVSLARLQHPNIVAVYDCGHTDGRAFFAMELLAGEDLGERLARTGPLDERTAWLVARQTAAALDHAANHGVIHRDVKPANLFLVPPPTGFPLPAGVPMVKVTDFGLALTYRGPDDSDPTQTAAGVILGTPVYMAPEQFRGGPVDVRADIYSLGVTVYHVLTGRVPFDGRTVLDVMAQKAGPPERLPAQFSEKTADLVAAMTAPDARTRPSTYADLIARIDALPCLDGAFSAAGLPAVAVAPTPHPVPAPESAPAPKRKRWPYAVAAVAVVILVAIGVRVTTHRTPEKKPATYAAGAQAALFDGKNVPPWSGRNLDIGLDGEKKNVLTGWGALTRPLPALSNFRVTFALDPDESAIVDVVLATADGPTATQWLVRLDRATGAAFGKRDGPNGAFEPSGPVVPIPTSKQRALEGLPPYLELKYERAGGTLAAWFNYQPLGATPDAGLRTTELRITTTGPIRIESAGIEELVEEK